MLRVLIADDEAPFVDSLLRFDWEQWQCRCVGTAYNGREALRKCRELMPHIVITDIHMPVMDGITLMQHLRDEYPEIQIILLTVHCQFDYARKAVQAGAIDYIVKDMNYRNGLAAAIEKAREAFAAGGASERRSRLLSRSAKLLELDAAADSIINDGQLDGFIRKNTGMLAAVRLRERPVGANGLLEEIDSMYSLQNDSPGVILWNDGLFELITPRAAGSVEAWIRELMRSRVPPFRNGEGGAQIAYGGPVSGLADYRLYHQRCISTLELAFYIKQPDILPARDIRMDPLQQTIAEQWMEKTELPGENAQSIQKFVREEVVPQLRQTRPAPGSVRDAFQNWFNRYELRYASSAARQAYRQMAESRTVEELAEKFLDAVGALLPASGGYSFQIGTAIGYIPRICGSRCSSSTKWPNTPASVRGIYPAG
jgi:DNA-binding NarL/FixJ family response regulator